MVSLFSLLTETETAAEAVLPAANFTAGPDIAAMMGWGSSKVLSTVEER